MQDETDLAGSSINRFAENTYAKITARYVMPVVLTALGWLLVSTVGDMKDSVKNFRDDMMSIRTQFWSSQAKLSENQAQLGAALAVLSAKVDNNRQRSDEADARVTSDLNGIKAKLSIK